ncbi:hypothetical protein LguiA_007695 [Lonicera macranthoides]
MIQSRRINFSPKSLIQHLNEDAATKAARANSYWIGHCLPSIVLIYSRLLQPSLFQHKVCNYISSPTELLLNKAVRVDVPELRPDWTLPRADNIILRWNWVVTNGIRGDPTEYDVSTRTSIPLEGKDVTPCE